MQVVGTADASDRKSTSRVGVQRQTNADLAQIVLALDASGRFASCLDRRQQKRHEYADDRDHDDQLNQRHPRGRETAQASR